MQKSPRRVGMSFPELKSCEHLFLVAFQYENERQEILASQISHPTSHLRQDCCQHYIMAAVALGRQLLVTPQNRDLLVFPVICPGAARPPW